MFMRKIHKRISIVNRARGFKKHEVKLHNQGIHVDESCR
jgi:hypothetical protein